MDRGHGCRKTLMLTTASMALLHEVAPARPEKVNTGTLRKLPTSLPLTPNQKLSPLHLPLLPWLPTVCIKRDH